MQKKQLINLSILFITIITYQQQNIAAPIEIWDEIKVEGYDLWLPVDENRQIHLQGKGPGTEPVTIPVDFDTNYEKYVVWRGKKYPVLVHCIKTINNTLYDTTCGVDYVKVVNNKDVYSNDQILRSYSEYKKLLQEN